MPAEQVYEGSDQHILGEYTAVAEGDGYVPPGPCPRAAAAGHPSVTYYQQHHQHQQQHPHQQQQVGDERSRMTGFPS